MPYTSSLGRRCLAFGCDYTEKKRYLLLNTKCSVHKQLRKNCHCEPVFKFHKFPSDPLKRKLWIRNLNRDDVNEVNSRKSSFVICSQHFIDGEPTKANPYPVLYMEEPTCSSEEEFGVRNDSGILSAAKLEVIERDVQYILNKLCDVISESEDPVPETEEDHACSQHSSQNDLITLETGVNTENEDSLSARRNKRTIKKTFKARTFEREKLFNRLRFGRPENRSVLISLLRESGDIPEVKDCSVILNRIDVVTPVKLSELRKYPWFSEEQDTSSLSYVPKNTDHSRIVTDVVIKREIEYSDPGEMEFEVDEEYSEKPMFKLSPIEVQNFYNYTPKVPSSPNENANSSVKIYQYKPSGRGYKSTTSVAAHHKSKSMVQSKVQKPVKRVFPSKAPTAAKKSKSDHLCKTGKPKLMQGSPSPKVIKTVKEIAGPKQKSTLNVINGSKPKTAVKVISLPRQKSSIKVTTGPKQNSTVKVISLPKQKSAVKVISLPKQKSAMRVISLPKQQRTVKVMSGPKQKGTMKIVSGPKQKNTVKVISGPKQKDMKVISHPKPKSTVKVIIGPKQKNTVKFVSESKQKNTVKFVSESKQKSSVKVFTNPEQGNSIKVITQPKQKSSIKHATGVKMIQTYSKEEILLKSLNRKPDTPVKSLPTSTDITQDSGTESASPSTPAGNHKINGQRKTQPSSENRLKKSEPISEILKKLRTYYDYSEEMVVEPEPDTNKQDERNSYVIYEGEEEEIDLSDDQSGECLADALTDEKCLSYTGISLLVFKGILGILKECAPKYSSTVNMNVKDQILLVLIKLKLGLINADLSAKFNTTPTTCGKIFSQWLSVMHEMLNHMVVWQTRESIQQTMPEPFKKHLPKAACLIDVGQISIQLPSKENQPGETECKSGTTMNKFLFAVSPDGFVMFVSKRFEQTVSESQMFTDSGIKEKLVSGDLVLASKEITEGVDLSTSDIAFDVLPHSKAENEGQPLSELSKKALESLKVFRILRGVITVPMHNADHVLKTCAALSNLGLIR